MQNIHHDMALKRIILLILLSVGVMTVGAQEKFNPVQFRANLHKRIVIEAQLSQEESEIFFPIYDEMKEKQRAIHKQMKELSHQKPASDAACKSVILKRDKLEMQMKQLESSYHDRFLKILSPSKVYDILRAESRFHRETFRKMAKKCH